MNYDEQRVERAIAAVRRGEFVVVADDPQRENEGDLIARADLMTREKMAFLLRHSSGLVCVAITAERASALSLPLMVAENTESHTTAFTVSVDAKVGTTTGVSAADRALTVRALSNSETRPEDLARPGHVFPLRARAGGVLARAGHTEATVDLALLSGGPAVGVLCELMDHNGEMLRGAELPEFSAKHGLSFLTIEDLREFRRRHSSNVRRITPRWSSSRGGSTAAQEASEQQPLLDLAHG